MGLPCVRAVYYDVLHISPSQIGIGLQNESQHACGYGAIFKLKSVSEKEGSHSRSTLPCSGSATEIECARILACSAMALVGGGCCDLASGTAARSYCHEGPS